MAGHVVQAHAARERAGDRRHEGLDRLEGVGERRRLAEELGSTPSRSSGCLIGGAAQHDAVDMRKVRRRRGEIGDSAVDAIGSRDAPL